MRQLTKTLFNELKDEKSKLHELLEYVQNDDTLDMEFRENSFTLYYRGGELLSVSEPKPKKYVWNPLDANYNDGHKLKNNPENFEEYIPEAKHLIDYHICISKKNHLGEKEIQQLVVKENNYSPNSQDTDYFIVDMEYTEGGDKDKTRFDLIAVRWDSNGPARKKDEVSLAIIEVKQGTHSVISTKSRPGLRTHQKDFNAFIQKKKEEKSLADFCDDIIMIFKQKCELKLIRTNEKMKKITRSSDLQLKTSEIDFICLLANYKDRSRALEIEFIGMDECKFIKSSLMGYGLFASQIFSITPKYPNMKSDYLEYEKKKQATILKEYRTSFFNNAQDIGYSRKNHQWYDYILKAQYNANNLYHCIQKGAKDTKGAIEYFKKYNIAWWQCLNKSDEPTGHLVSSQIHCLNHLFALRTDKDAVKLIIEKATGVHFDYILPSLIDDDPESYISFEFAFHNDEWLQENDKGARRGTMCTSIDAMIFAEKDGAKWLIPIEWKFTERYDREDKTNRKRLKRYKHLIELSNRLQIPADGIAHSAYFIEPNYELMRQTLLCEQIIEHGYAKDFFHINIIPTKNTELRKAVETEFMPMLTKDAKFKIIDPQELLSPLQGNDDYKELLNYLETRYWKSL